MVDPKTQRNMVAVLRVLQSAGRPLGAEKVSEGLRFAGTELSERAVRNYLAQADERGWTQNLGRRGRRLTPAGRKEIEGALVMEKVGFVSARVSELAYEMDFDPQKREGTVILNVSTLAQADLRTAFDAMARVYDARLGMGRLVSIGYPGDRMGGTMVPEGRVAIGTICSVSINGLFLAAKVAAQSRFGGLLQMERGEPKRFTQLINYDGTSLDPLEIFIRGQMTSVLEAATTGSGIIGASFREAPTVSLPVIRRLTDLSEQIGLGGLIAIGQPNQPLFDIPVSQGCVGLVVAGGLNPVAAVVESGIGTTSSAMHCLAPFDCLVDYETLRHARSRPRRPQP